MFPESVTSESSSVFAIQTLPSTVPPFRRMVPCTQNRFLLTASGFGCPFFKQTPSFTVPPFMMKVPLM